LIHNSSTLSLTGLTLQHGNVVRPTGGGAVVQRSSGSCSLLICCFRCARVALISPHQITIFSLPLVSLRSMVLVVLLLLVVPSASTATWTPRHARSRTTLLWYVASVACAPAALVPFSPIPSYAGRRLWWCSGRG
jgi:hypothetical protein